MTPRRNRSHAYTPDVLSEKVDTLEGRVEDLEKEDAAREKSSEGIRRELADHRVEDAKVAGELKGLIADVDKRLETFGARLGAMKWMLALLIAIGLANGIIAVVKLAAK